MPCSHERRGAHERPDTWSKHGATAFERELLDAAKRDRAPHLLKLHMGEALSALPPAAAVQSTARSAGATASSGGLLFSPPVLWGSLAALILAGAVGWQMARTPAPVAQPTVPPATAPLAVSVPEPAPVALPEAPEPPAPAARPAPLAAAAPRAIPAQEPAMRLREELALLDAARTALATHDSDRALQLLERHTTEFARGHLAPEADALRIDAYLQRGASDRAERLSRRFLARYPTHPLAARIGSVARSN
jgi:hypothetical protein